MLTSELIRKRLIEQERPFHANDAIGDLINADELASLLVELEIKFQSVLETLVIDTDHDHNTKGTAQRLAKMYLLEVFAGRYGKPPAVAHFPNAKKMDELYTLGPIGVRSACSHHFCPIEGDLWVGIIPSEKVIGISKFSRLSRWVFARPQIQEEAIIQLADLLEEHVKPNGLAVVVRARHGCMTWRGVKESSTNMTTSVVRGLLKDNVAARAEFYSMIAAQGFAP